MPTTPFAPAVVVFGGAGFIGTHLLRRLASEGVYRLISLDWKAPARPVEGVDYQLGDVRDLADFQVDGPIDTIYNLAAVHTTPGHPTHEYYETNVKGATQITAFARRNGVDHIVFTSSISVYGPSETTKLETSPPDPNSAYGWSKWLAEDIHRAWLNEDPARKLVICRPAVIFGYGEGGNFTRLAKLLRAGVFVYPGRKDTIKACFYVGDLVQSLLTTRGLEERYILYNGCYPDRYTLEQIIETFRTAHFPKAKTVMVPRVAVSGVAAALKPVSALGLGIHPDRVTKLVKSTDVAPGWLTERGYAASGRLVTALQGWRDDSDGRFD
ncbi:hypothetical protein LTR94_024328 [Friedmanniomyces endolithicus]|nr:hypothetical protein LTR94_024328 [Friedmanniomyces endolithicus]